MIKGLSLIVFAAALVGCSTVNDPPQAGTGSEPIERMPGDDSPCDAGPARQYVGQKATQSIGTMIAEATGARVFQWVGPNMAVTMDYRPDRVRVSYDAEMTITAIRCG